MFNDGQESQGRSSRKRVNTLLFYTTLTLGLCSILQRPRVLLNHVYMYFRCRFWLTRIHKASL